MCTLRSCSKVSLHSRLLNLSLKRSQSPNLSSRRNPSRSKENSNHNLSHSPSPSPKPSQLKNLKKS